MAAPKFKPPYVAAWLRAAGLNKRDLAEATGWSEQHVGAICNGHKQWNQEFLEDTARFLNTVFPGITPGDLIGVDPFAQGAVSIFDAARKVPPAKQEAARDMLQGLAGGAAVPLPASPAQRPRRRRSRS